MEFGDGEWARSRNAQVEKAVRCNPTASTAGAVEAVPKLFDDVGRVVVFQDNFASAFELVGADLGAGAVFDEFQVLRSFLRESGELFFFLLSDVAKAAPACFCENLIQFCDVILVGH